MKNKQQTTVKQLIEHLQTLPQEAEVYARNDWGGLRKLDSDNYNIYVSDFREGKNQLVKEGHQLFGRVIVDIIIS